MVTHTDLAAMERRVKVHVVPWLPNHGMMLGKHMLLLKGHEDSVSLRHHELVHAVQQEREGLVRFFAKYTWEYLKNLKRMRSHKRAYRAISYEVEARSVSATFRKIMVVD